MENLHLHLIYSGPKGLNHMFSVAICFLTNFVYLLIYNHNQVRNVLSDRAVSYIMYLM